MDDRHDERKPDRDDADGGGGAAAPVREVDFASLMDDPDAFVGGRIRVTGNVFFFSECPPPGAGSPKCTLLGYLADPEHRTFLAADTTTALPLAEAGVRLACEESGGARPACEGWTADARYTLEGVIEYQTLGGRLTTLVQLHVVEKSAPEPW